MKKIFLLILLFSLTYAEITSAQEPDSLFFYKSGNIVYKESALVVDSITFVPLDYYHNLRCNTVLNSLKSNPLLSRFEQMIRIAGYEKNLDYATIWAPVNRALEQVNLSDTAAVRRIVGNQIAPAIYTANSMNNGSEVTMVNNKKHRFNVINSSFCLDSIAILTPNMYSAGSIIHVMNAYAPYQLNIWEYITEGSGHDSLRTYVNSHTKTTYNASTGTYVTTNDLKEKLVATTSELSYMSAIIPTDQAWNDAYARLYPYCAVPSNDLTDQADATRFAIIRNNFYAGKLNPALTDTVYKSTSGYLLKTPSAMLEGAQETKLSNGSCYTVSQLKMYNPEFWNKEIRIEAEDNTWGRTATNYTESYVPDDRNEFTVSNNKYLLLTDASTNSLATLYVTFPIPNTLSAKYNIYCVFLPSTIVDPNDERPFKVKFFLTYMDNKSGNGTAAPQGVKVTNAAIDANNVVVPKSTASATFTTNPATITKMLVAKDFTFPFSNLIYNNVSDITVALKVQNVTGNTAAEMINYNRTLRIDCIILEPIQ